MPIVPTGKSGLLCMPKIACTLRKCPASITLQAPLLLSSAGWNMKRTVPFRADSLSFNKKAVPKMAAV
ncbi:Uncharacterised protein [Streptococcus pneumoniae]|nr:Uncharacterised protein [Streptococcus pneumoniae]